MDFFLRQHALQRMFERNITLEDIRDVVHYGQIIEDYPDDTPFPSGLWLGRDAHGRPIHVVVANNAADNQYIIITAYHPNPLLWSSDWTTRRNKS